MLSTSSPIQTTTEMGMISIPSTTEDPFIATTTLTTSTNVVDGNSNDDETDYPDYDELYWWLSPNDTQSVFEEVSGVGATFDGSVLAGVVLFPENSTVPEDVQLLACPNPPTLPHAMLLVYGRNVGDYASYHCLQGYTFGTNDVLRSTVCQFDQTWYPIIPDCQGRL